MQWKYEAERVAAELAATSSSLGDTLADSQAKVFLLLVCLLIRRRPAVSSLASCLETTYAGLAIHKYWCRLSMID